MDNPTKTNRVQRRIWTAAGAVCVFLGMVGAVLPVMPTTCFLIAALACFGKGSPERAEALLKHPRFGPTLRAWREQGAIPGHAKCVAVVSMLVGWLLLLNSGVDFAVTALVGTTLAGVAVWIVGRPRPTYSAESDH